jgi:DNA helicase HerA-like ATPase
VAGASEVREVVVLDEAHKFFAEKDTNVLDILARESRKFGIALICASQAPSHFSEDFLGNVGTKILLGLDSQYHDSTVRKMRVDSKVLEYVVAGKIAAVQVSDKRDMSHRFYKTRVGN